MLKTRFFRKTLNLVFAVATISFIVLIQTTDAHGVSAQSEQPASLKQAKLPQQKREQN
ncbi:MULTISPECIES: hypothetical protein [unclassified Pseudoalteromonas]|uniref:hypothetical protein n=1 Tax=unclassified Pseudoalteromonas TaxID=194690 RepID=UPI003014FF5F